MSAVGLTGLAAGTTRAAGPYRSSGGRDTAVILGREVDVSLASPEVVRLFTSFFEAKTAADVDATMAHFARDMTYIDATLGWSWYRWQDLHDLFAGLMPTWPKTAASYPTRIIGDATSALVHFTDTPELFGHEIRPLGAVDFRRGRIVRWIDYWDGRAFTLAGIREQRTPADRFPADFGESAVGERAAPQLRSVVKWLGAAFGAGDASGAAALFHPDAVFDDLAAHVHIEGRTSLADFLRRALPVLPYGAGSRVRHAVGGARGGGYEWTNPGAPAPRGNTALALDRSGLITRLTTVWDSSLWTDGRIGRVQGATILQ
ncbi:nuclear transport factor 2 family protein [Streptomyces sp. J2-1]|uniref:nuclear transport factor 2 family protein n=1 Tax=Streptomyces corallincola TaxID=2851888 RepID=UPI001C38C029|nr:nuclear transport factor 2 family protein [Streptomyces corallincola]MBV2357600.1 nuclear transport factor 2 family protein [Streptomyces corallincola]